MQIEKILLKYFLFIGFFLFFQNFFLPFRLTENHTKHNHYFFLSKLKLLFGLATVFSTCNFKSLKINTTKKENYAPKFTI